MGLKKIESKNGKPATRKIKMRNYGFKEFSFHWRCDMIMGMITKMMIIIIMIMIMIMMLDHGWRPRGGERAQRDTVLKLITMYFAEIQNWGRC